MWAAPGGLCSVGIRPAVSTSLGAPHPPAAGCRPPGSRVTPSPYADLHRFAPPEWVATLNGAATDAAAHGAVVGAGWEAYREDAGPVSRSSDACLPAALVPGGRPIKCSTTERTAMTELQKSTGAIPAPATERDRLDGLISRVAGGDRAAFRRMYAFMAMRVWHVAMEARLSRTDGVAVVRSTFVEVWHMAGAAFRYDARDWMTAVASVRVNDRLSILDVDRRRANPAGASDSAGRRHQRPDVADHDADIHRELTALLGTAGATIRTGPGRFTRIANLDDAPTAIATTWAAAMGRCSPETRESRHVHQQA